MSRYLARKAKNGQKPIPYELPKLPKRVLTVLTVTQVGVFPETMACSIPMKPRLTNEWHDRRHCAGAVS
jgi:hypothetical protein